MRIKPFLSSLFLAIAVVLTFSNCASLTGFQTGKTVGKNQGEILVSLNASQTPKFDLDVDQNDTSDIPRFYFPNVEVSGRYGITERLDVGLRLNTNVNIAIDGRYQLLGDQNSPVALAAGFGVGTFGAFAGLWNVQIPLYFSLHPTETMAIYLSPRYTAQFGVGDLAGNIRYVGGNAGMIFGKNVKFGFDAGIHTLKVRKFKGAAIGTFGVGVKFPLGNRE